jgi:hypothetical protein
MAQVPNLAAKNGLGDKPRGIGFYYSECLGHFLEKNNISTFPDESCNVAPSAGAWNVIIRYFELKRSCKADAFFSRALY